VKTEIDPAGGTAYTVTSVTQLLSVPYALYAKTSGSSTPGPTGPQGPAGSNGAQGLQGVAGPQGPAGPAGPQGIQGATGLQGPAGAQGPSGVSGSQGVQGDPGLSAYQIWLNNGNTGSEAVFLAQYQNVKPDWDAAAGSPAEILNKPNISGASFSGDYNDLTNKPTGTNPGDILYWEDNSWKVLHAGLDGQVLTSVKGKLTWKEIMVLAGSGDLYDEGDIFYSGGEPEGIIIEMSLTGQYAKLLSLTEYDAAWDTDTYNDRTNATNANNGVLNMEIIKNLPMDIAAFPAFKACRDLGDEWYLPSFNEMRTIVSKKAEIEIRLATVPNAVPFGGKFYWTSTEKNVVYANAVAMSDSTFTITEETLRLIELDFSHLLDANGDLIPGLDPMGKDTTLVAGDYFSIRKTQVSKVRPVRYLSWAEMNSKPKSNTIYAVGDVYPDSGTPEGVVVEIWNGGLNGKIISLNEDSLQWSNEKVLLNATSGSDGSLNRETVKQRDLTMVTYPAFKWCLDKGTKWYLPAISELQNIYNNIVLINTALTGIGNAKTLSLATGANNSYYWSSSEEDAEKASQWNFNASASEIKTDKTAKALIRAIRTF
jgi:hypothetical protein